MASASARGWGPGWPNCQRDKLVTVALDSGPRFPVRREIAELVGLLCIETERLGYDLRREDSWGFACRAIRGTNRPSNHSWGLAIDLNARSNPMGLRLVTDIPARVVALWERFGFTWGGRWTRRPDAMHFEFNGTPADAARLTAQVRGMLGQEEETMLSKGDEGAAVKLVQRCLENEATKNGRPPALPEYGADGGFGQETEDAVKRYQRNAHLPQTGRVDGFVLALLLRYEHI